MSVIKHAAEKALALPGVSRIARWRMRGRTLVLAYHNVVGRTAPPRGDTSLHLELDKFRRHLDVIQSATEPVGIERLFEGGGDRVRVAITFDDAYRGTIRNALPELTSRGIPATVFVPPAFVPNRPFWWDDLGRSGGLSAIDRSMALDQLRGRDDEIRRRFADRLSALPGALEDQECASVDEIRDAVRSQSITLGSHSWSHPNLVRATDDELKQELERPLGWLREHFPANCLPAISYPYGLCSEAVEMASRNAGYTMGFLIEGGWLSSPQNNLLTLPRLNVPAGLSPEGLALRLGCLFA